MSSSICLRHSGVLLSFFTGIAGHKLHSSGHYFPVNPGMLNSRKGQQIVAKLPPNGVLTKTDGPFIKIGNRSCRPEDVAYIEEQLGTI